MATISLDVFQDGGYADDSGETGFQVLLLEYIYRYSVADFQLEGSS